MELIEEEVPASKKGALDFSSMKLVEDTPIKEDDGPTTSAVGAFGRSAQREAAPALAGLAAFVPGFKTGAALTGLATLNPILSVVGGLVGGVAATVITSSAVKKGQDALVGSLSEETQKTIGMDKAQESLDTKQHPYATAAGSFAPHALAFRPGMASKLDPVVGAAVELGVEGGSQLAEGKFDPTMLAVKGVGGAVFNKPTALGKKLGFDFSSMKLVEAELPTPSIEEVVKEGRSSGVDVKEPVKFNEVQAKVDKEEQQKKDREFDATPEGKALAIEDTKPGAPLARTRPDGSTRYNEAAIEQDFNDDFPYIFHPKGPSGEQKAAVFESLGLTKEVFSKQMPDLDVYKAFLKGHEESRVTNKDHDTYPRAQGEDGKSKADLMHPDAIKIETRATIGGMKAAQEFYEARGIAKKMADDAETNPISLKASREILVDQERFISMNTWKADSFGKRLLDMITHPGIRDRVTRALEGQLERDVILTDKKKIELLYGTGKTVKGRVDGGMRGALAGMDNLLAQGKVGRSFKGTIEEYKAKRDKLEYAFKNLESLPSEEFAIPILALVKERFAVAGALAKKVGLFDATLENYVTHVLDFSKTKMTPEQQKLFTEKIFGEAVKNKLNRDFTVKRQYEFLRELEAKLRDEGSAHGVVVLTDIARILPIYEKSIYSAIAFKEMRTSLSKALSPNGKPWLVPNTPEAIKAGYVEFTGRGSSNLEGLVVHRELVDAMTHLMNISDPNMIVRAMGAISHIVKIVNTMASFFHAKSIIEGALLLDFKGTMKEIFNGAAGVKAAKRAIMAADPTASVKVGKVDYNMVDMIEKLMLKGLKLTTEDINRSPTADLGVLLDRGLSKLYPGDTVVPIVQHLTNALESKVIQPFNTFTWDYVHAGGKLMMAVRLFANMKLKNPELPDDQLLEAAATAANRVFGGLEWAKEAGRINNKFASAIAMQATGKTNMERAHILVFAPDWTASGLLSISGAFPKELTKPHKWKVREGVKGITNPKTHEDFARRYVITTAVAWLTLLNGLNMAASGRPIWENEDPTRLEFVDGTSMQVAKQSMEPVHWALDPVGTAAFKFGLFPQAAYIAGTGKQYPYKPFAGKGELSAPDVEDAYGSQVLGRALTVMGRTLPFAIQSAMSAPKGDGLERAGLATAGLSQYGQTKEQLAEKIKEGKTRAREYPKEKPANIPTPLVRNYESTSFSGSAVRVIDGDSVLVQREDGKQIMVRLADLNAAEWNAKGGVEQKDSLTKLIQGKSVVVYEHGKDKYGRTLGKVYLDGVGIGETQSKQKMGQRRLDYLRYEDKLPTKSPGGFDFSSMELIEENK